MNTVPAIRGKNGFTLFELLIALFIGTMLIMSGAYSIKMGLFTMERDEVWFNASTKEKAAYDFFWQQVSSLRIQKIPSKDPLLTEDNKKTKKKKTIFFSGEKDSLAFVTPLSMTKHYGQGLVIANYKVKINEKGLWDLIYVESMANPSIMVKFSEESEIRFGLDKEKDITKFFQDCDAISFAYLDTAEDEENEDGQKDDGSGKKITITRDALDADVIEGTDLKWKEKTIEKIPQAIRITVVKNGKESEMVTSIMATYSFLASGR